MDYARSVKKKKIDFFKEAPLWQASLFFIKRGPLTRSDGDGMGVYMYSVPIPTFYTFILLIRSAKTVTELKKR